MVEKTQPDTEMKKLSIGITLLLFDMYLFTCATNTSARRQDQKLKQLQASCAE